MTNIANVPRIGANPVGGDRPSSQLPVMRKNTDPRFDRPWLNVPKRWFPLASIDWLRCKLATSNAAFVALLCLSSFGLLCAARALI